MTSPIAARLRMLAEDFQPDEDRALMLEAAAEIDALRLALAGAEKGRGWHIENSAKLLVQVTTLEARCAELALEAFELGYCWRGALVGQTLEDSRAVGRTLVSDLFTAWQPIDVDSVPSFESADTGIFHAKNAIRAAIKARSAIAPAGGEGE